jgi:ribosomal protein S27AE
VTPQAEGFSPGWFGLAFTHDHPQPEDFIMVGPFYNPGLNAGAASAARDAAGARSTAARAQTEVTYLEQKVERLTLICMALWSLLQDKTKLTEQDLLDRVKLLDEIDGVSDGQITTGVMKCPKCNRTLTARHRKCLYCGHEREVASAFDLL